MPQISPRKEILAQLEPFIVLYQTNPLFRHIYHFLPTLYALVKSRRYIKARDIVAKIGKWTASRLDALDDVRAKRDIRMSRAAFDTILGLLRDNPVFRNKKGPPPAPVELQLQVFVYYAATSSVGGSYHNIAQHFGIGEGTVRKFVVRVMEALYGQRHDVIRWPTAAERLAIASAISARCGLRGAVGVIDGTSFELKYKPKEEHEIYYNRKSRYGVGAQIVCDHTRLIRATLIGNPSSVHDSRQHKSMAIALRPSEFFSGGEFLIGDSAYALASHLMRPYKAPKSKIQENKRFNYHFSAMRMTIEHCIEDDERNEEFDLDEVAATTTNEDESEEEWTPANELLLEVQKHLVLMHYGYL